MRRLEDYKVWQQSISLGLKVYEVTKAFPKEELYGLVSQMRRCAVSISSNIAEGAGRNTDKEFTQFLGYASGSAYELQTQLIYAKELGFVNENTSELLLKEVVIIQKMTYRLIESIKK